MASIARLVVSLGANTGQFETDMQRAAGISKRQFNRMEQQGKRLAAKWDRNFKLAGAAVAAGLAVAIKSAAEFENAMAEVSTLIDDSTTDSMANLAKSVNDLSVEFGQMPTTQAKALYQIISAGAEDAATQVEQLTVANKLAVGGVTDVATAADGLTTVINAYAESNITAEEVSDILFTTMKKGKTTIGELSQGIGNVATIAAQTGVPFEELGAAVGTLTKAGLGTNQAMEGLRGVLSAVLKQSDQSVKMAEELGIAFNATALETKGLAGFLQDIADSGATSEQLAKLFGRVEGLNAVMALGSEDMKEFIKQLEAQEKAAGATGEAVEKMADQTKFAMDQARAAFEVAKNEIGGRFLLAVKSASVAIVKYMDDIVRAVEALVALLTIRLAVAGVRGLAAATTGAYKLAAAFAFLGGPVGAITLSFGAFLLLLDRWAEKQLAANEFIKVSNALLIKQAEGYRNLASAAQLASLSIAIDEKRKALLGEIANLEKQMAKIEKDKNKLLNQTTLQQKVLNAELEELQLHLRNAKRNLEAYNKASEETNSLQKTFKDRQERINKLWQETDNILDDLIKNEKARLKIGRDLAKAQKDAEPRIKAINKLWDETTKILNELISEEEEYQRNLERLLDTLYPVQAAGRQLGDELAILERAFNEGKISAERFEEEVRKLTDAFTGYGDETKEVILKTDRMTEAMLEGTRIIERAFTSLWEDMLSGADNAFDGIMDGFKTLLANLAHQAITSPIIVNIQQGIAGTNPNVPGGGINWPQLGADIGQFLSIIAGAQIGGGGIFANVGAIAGALGGQALGQGLGWWLGTLGGPIGMALGSVLGGIVGGILDDLLGSDRPAELNLAGNQRYAGLSSSDTEGIIKSLFGETFLTTRRIDSQALGQISQGLQEFDNAIAGFLSAGQIGLITDALANWNIHLSGEAINMETLLGSRFAVILSTFTQDIQDFVNRGEDLTSQIDRLQIGVGVQNIMDAAPDLFSGRTTADFLAVVTAFQDGTETITDAFNEVIALLDIIVIAQASLRDFADSDLGSDFEALMTDANITLTEAVAGMNAAVMDAINNFDGSPEQLRNIALMVTGIREGELKLLAQIDSIQKGINTNLDKLKADILGVTEEPKTAQELADQARGLIAQVSLATSPGEIAALAQQFEALIRQISPEDQALMQDQLLGLIDRFQTASDDALDLQRQATLDNATAMRDLVDVFLTDIGDPLAILAASNQSAADALQAIADGTESTDLMMEHHGRTEEILDGGLEDMNTAISGIGPQVASAVRSAVQNVDVNVFVTVSDTDLVNE